MVSLPAADAGSGHGTSACDDYDHAEKWRDYLPGRVTGSEAGGETTLRSAYAKGMFIFIRATSVLCTTADFAMWRLSLPLFEESR